VTCLTGDEPTSMGRRGYCVSVRWHAGRAVNPTPVQLVDDRPRRYRVAMTLSTSPAGGQLKGTLGLRPYQREALVRVREAYRAGKRRVLISLPTGTGKTVVFAHFPRVLKMKKRLLVLAHRVWRRESVTATRAGLSVSVLVATPPAKTAAMTLQTRIQDLIVSLLNPRQSTGIVIRSRSTLLPCSAVPPFPDSSPKVDSSSRSDSSTCSADRSPSSSACSKTTSGVEAVNMTGV
jgi:hypothetical protein